MTTAWLGMDMSKTLARGTRGLAGRRAVSSFLHNHWLSAGWYREGAACARAGCTVRDVSEKRIAVPVGAAPIAAGLFPSPKTSTLSLPCQPDFPERFNDLCDFGDEWREGDTRNHKSRRHGQKSLASQGEEPTSWI
jgi:hypothetical protein